MRLLPRLKALNSSTPLLLWKHLAADRQRDNLYHGGVHAHPKQYVDILNMYPKVDANRLE